MENSERDKKDIMGQERVKNHWCEMCGMNCMASCPHCGLEAFTRMRWSWAATLEKLEKGYGKISSEEFRRERYQDSPSPERRKDA